MRRLPVTPWRRDSNEVASGKPGAVQRHDPPRVMHSAGRDAYKGEAQEWALIGKYFNAQSKEQGRQIKTRFALLPSVDHVGDELGKADFKICAWRTNDAKNDLSLRDFVDLCRRVVKHWDGGLSAARCATIRWPAAIQVGCG